MSISVPIRPRNPFPAQKNFYSTLPGHREQGCVALPFSKPQLKNPVPGPRF